MQGAALTPMFRQYRALKAENPGAILFFRMGDFYEMFDEDARTASALLDLTLTARGKGTAHAAPMCGFPWHQLDAYAARLARAGHRVAVCDQVEDPRIAKGLVKRDVVRIITPGTLDDPEDGERRVHAWIAGVARAGDRVGAAFLDTATGEFLAWEASGEDAARRLAERLEVFTPREIVHAEGDALPEAEGPVLTPADPFAFQPRAALDLLKRHFQVESLDGFGLGGKTAAIAAAGGLLAYVRDNARSGLEHVDALVVHDPAQHLRLDPASLRSLEIDRSLRDGARAGSLLGAIDRTLTAAGGRLLRGWLTAPLLSREPIARRHDAVEEGLARGRVRERVREQLRGMHDVERLLGRAVAGTAGARDLLGIRAWLDRVPAVVEALADAREGGLLREAASCDPCADLCSRLASVLRDDPPAGLREGGLVRDGESAELDELRAIRRDGRATIAALETKERESTGIASLKVRFNKVFGYYIEVSRANLHLVPETYQRKQTISGGERFVTPELKDFETKVLTAQERIETLEYEIFVALREEVARAAPRLKAAARAFAAIDALTALAEIAAERDYRRPRLVEEPVLDVTAGRHPVVEQTLVESRFTPNDAKLSPEEGQLAILTGPNMGGKSTFLRQNALLVLLAQAGSFVPAEQATLGIADRIFCRVGASDNLAEGQSTFMVEMAETANILRHATPRSVVLLDEIGRGTSTFDGLAIAWSVAETLAAQPGGTPRTLFATHYHELTELAVTLPGVVNLRMAVKEWGERVVFTHHVETGAADRSYGIHVARLAGVPRAVVARAAEILANLERDEYGGDGMPRRARRGDRGTRAAERPLFAPVGTAAPAGPAVDPAERALLGEILAQEPERLTPLEALALVDRWKRRLKGPAGEP
jgi:DNA mismatch repair protein MutS